MDWFGGRGTTKPKQETKRDSDLTVERVRKLAECYVDEDPNDYLGSPRFSGFSEKDCALYDDHQRYLRFRKENQELRDVIHGNKEYYGHFQTVLENKSKELESTKLHLQLEKEAFNKLYIEKRELEGKLYAINRELELKELKEQNGKDAS